MKRRVLGCAAGVWLAVVLAWIPAPRAAAPGRAGDRRAPRKLLYPSDPGRLAPVLAPVVKKLLSGEEGPASPRSARPSGVFLRVVSRRFALDGGKLKEGAWLGPRPFVFLTLPEAAYGRSLLQVLLAIGY